MSTTPDTVDLEQRLRAALTARADLVRPEDLAPLAPAAPLRPRWSPWVLLATAAAVLLVLGVVLQGLGRDPRSDDVAPRPDEPPVVLPDDVGRDWEADDVSTPARLDLDGDGTDEVVDFLGEPTEDFDGRTRLETTLSSTGEEAYGIAELGTTIGTTALPPVDADGDGDQELVLRYDDPAAGPAGGGHPVVFDLRDGLLVEAVAEEPELLLSGDIPVPGTKTEHYEMVHQQDFWVEDGELWSSRSVNAYARGNMTIVRPLVTVRDAWTWRLTEDGRLEHVDAGCLRHDVMDDARTPCEDGAADDLPDVADVAEESIGLGESATFDDGYAFTARLEAVADPSLVVEGADGRTIDHALDVADPRVFTTQPVGVFADGASVVIASSSDPGYVQVLRQDGGRLRALDPVGEVDLTDDGSHRTWLTPDGTLVTAVAAEDDSWRLWFWQTVSRSEMAALPGAVVCFDDPTDPSTMRRC
ncbi:hypothetical protein [Nocardioides xinjiangensis]|uniref:hypothetical protein n=1 Tax=Nocardioides xinjiangensis TaxID=2817376 RepID=UPI001B301F10|nr:hypothetical protein [Nocardioides sp. SYSU D00514]